MKKYLKIKSFDKAPLAPATTARPVRSLRPMRSMSGSKGVRPAPLAATPSNDTAKQ